MSIEFQICLREAIDLEASLFSGQAFTWQRRGDRYVGFVRSAHLALFPTPQDPKVLSVIVEPPETITPQAVTDYFDDDTNYAALRHELQSIDPLCRRAIAYAPGLRLLRQDPWVTLVCFILSSCNNVPRITRIVQALRGLSRGQFPSPEELLRAGEERLRQAGTGFRAPYILSAARMVLQGAIDLDHLRSVPTDEAVEALTAIPGVGRKVASCVALYGLQKCDAFPVDIWMKKVLQEAYYGGRDVSASQLERFARNHFGSKAGYAQNWLYYWARRSRLAETSCATASRIE